MAPPVAPEDQVGLLSGEASLLDKKCPPNPKQLCCGCCCLVLALVIGVYYYLVHMLTGIAIDKFVTLHDHEVHEYCEEDVNIANIAEKVWWPGCGFNFTEGATCGEPCYSPDLVKEIMDFNKGQRPGRIVSYPSRPGVGAMDKDIETVTLRGWLLEASTDSHAHHPRPRIVIQHGYTSNSNKFRQVVMAVILRQLGFDVLLNNFRDHCYSSDSEIRVLEWGHAYPYDLLGAWDYLRKDPDGHLGGELHASKVGLVGISMGAFNTVNAFGMESEVPAAWADSPPESPKQVFSFGSQQELDSMGIGMLHSLLLEPVWKNTEDKAMESHVNLNEHLPSKVLPRGPDTKRPFALVGNVQDTTVKIQNVIDILHIAKDHPEKYEAQMWTVDDKCHERDHCVDHLSHFHEYKAKLCKFWYGVFGLDDGHCPEDAETPAMTDT